ncbi:hypothetical protein GCWU000341_01717 [Oribacterium sp. oral taxon 078 str. F0262]|nr:hypothetical protein GCWU000341_01717 [Oribacterium sp. oral taxon 078 str. F0262]
MLARARREDFATRPLHEHEADVRARAFSRSRRGVGESMMERAEV